MRYPQFLPEGGTIGFIAPSFGCTTEPYYSAFQNAQKVFAQKGFGIVCGPNVYEGSGIGISASPAACAQEFMDAYESDESDILLSCGGGELMCEILEHVDFDRIRKAKPKWFQGCSDNTNLTFLLTTLCDTAAIYGPNAPSFGMKPWHPSITESFERLQGKNLRSSGYPLYESEPFKDEDHPLEPYHVTEPRVIRSFACRRVEDGSFCAEQTQNAAFSGRLIGGCMDCLANLTGTVFDKVDVFSRKYQEDGLIWFLEACDLNVYAIRRAVWNMDHAGWFNHVKGFLIGRPLCHGQELFGLDQYTAVTDILKKYGVPIIMDLDIGHIPPQMALISGAMADVAVFGQDLDIRMRLE